MKLTKMYPPAIMKNPTYGGQKAHGGVLVHPRDVPALAARGWITDAKGEKSPVKRKTEKPKADKAEKSKATKPAPEESKE